MKLIYFILVWNDKLFYWKSCLLIQISAHRMRLVFTSLLEVLMSTFRCTFIGCNILVRSWSVFHFSKMLLTFLLPLGMSIMKNCLGCMIKNERFIPILCNHVYLIIYKNFHTKVSVWLIRETIHLCIVYFIDVHHNIKNSILSKTTGINFKENI